MPVPTFTIDAVAASMDAGAESTTRAHPFSRGYSMAGQQGIDGQARTAAAAVPELIGTACRDQCHRQASPVSTPRRASEYTRNRQLHRVSATVIPRSQNDARCGGQLRRPRVQRYADQPVMALAPCLARRAGADRATACAWRFRIQLLCHANASSSLTWRSCARSSGGLSAEQATAVPTAQGLTAPAHLAEPRHTERACAGAERTRAAADDPGGVAAQAVPATADTSPPPTRRLDCLISRIASGPRRSVRAGPGRRRIFIANGPGGRPVNRRQLRHRDAVAGRWVWRRQPVGATGWASRLSTREVIAQICGILGGPEGADRSTSAGHLR